VEKEVALLRTEGSVSKTALRLLLKAWTQRKVAFSRIGRGDGIKVLGEKCWKTEQRGQMKIGSGS